MNDDGALEQHGWGGYYRSPPLKGNLGLQLLSNSDEGITKPFLFDGSAGSYLHRECGITEPSSMPMGYARNVWYQNNRDGGKMLHVFPGIHHQHTSSYGAFVHGAAATAAGSSAHTFQMLQPLVIPKEEALAVIEDSGAQQDAVPLKKRSKGQGSTFKALKPKRSKKAIAPRERSGKSPRRERSGRKSSDMVISGLDLDLSGMPAPLCTCTGHPQQCYRWGAGGWQSACCTTSISMYPLPMSTKRRGSRIAGRKMSQGAFKKVLEKLAGEGQDFRSPIDLKTFWAKHGTNKFVTIR